MECHLGSFLYPLNYPRESSFKDKFFIFFIKISLKYSFLITPNFLQNQLK